MEHNPNAKPGGSQQHPHEHFKAGETVHFDHNGQKTGVVTRYADGEGLYVRLQGQTAETLVPHGATVTRG
jgi:hypothetical protein